MSGLPARLDHWASIIRNPAHEPGGDLRHDGFTDAEAMELSTLLTEAANEIVQLKALARDLVVEVAGLTTEPQGFSVLESRLSTLTIRMDPTEEQP